MTDTQPSLCIERSEIDSLFSALKQRGYQIVGPTVQNESIVFDELDEVEDLPIGWTDEQEAGKYSIKRRDDQALFGYNNGPHSWKKFLYPSRVKLWSANKTDDGFSVEELEPSPPQYAFIGVHSCDLNAIEIQDKIFMSPETADPRYGRKREKAFIIVAQCGQACATCFCDSMGTGPRAEKGFDLALNEIIDGDRHYFVIETGSERGAEVLADLKTQEAGETDTAAAQARTEKARSMQIRGINNEGIKEMLFGSYENPHWEKVAEKCLSCANCTLACPTCFCSKTEDQLSLDGTHAERWREWDSCFTLDFSYIHGGTIRQNVSSRYRQWMTHKLGAWIDQFGTSGCVGCGRCITWCPVGIDITEEVATLRASEEMGKEASPSKEEAA